MPTDHLTLRVAWWFWPVCEVMVWCASVGLIGEASALRWAEWLAERALRVDLVEG